MSVVVIYMLHVYSCIFMLFSAAVIPRVLVRCLDIRWVAVALTLMHIHVVECSCDPAGAREVPGYPLAGCGAYSDAYSCCRVQL